MTDDAYAIFLRSRSAVTTARYPRRLDYAISVSGLDGKVYKTNHYGANCDPADGTIRVLQFSQEELDSPPPRPHDFNFGKIVIVGPDGPIKDIPVGDSLSTPDLLGGAPILSPTYSFGIGYPYTNANDAPANQNSGSLPVIAVVASQSRAYSVTLVDTPVLNGTLTYHLRLTPLRRPHDNRLRELWVGATDYLPRQAVISGNFTVAPMVDVPWLVTFTIVDGALYVFEESASGDLFIAHRRVIRNAVVRFSDVHESSGGIIGEPIIAPDVKRNSIVEP